MPAIISRGADEDRYFEKRVPSPNAMLHAPNKDASHSEYLAFLKYELLFMIYNIFLITKIVIPISTAQQK